MTDSGRVDRSVQADARARSARPDVGTASGASGYSAADWLALCRGAVEDVRGVLVELPTRVERESVVGDGEGGDETTAIDAAAERVILQRLRDFEAATIVSEEVGILESDGPLRIVVDPIDGSLNAKRGIPFFSVSIAVADGDTMDDVFFGYVYDFGTGEEWTAERGKGALLNGADLGDVLPKERIEILSFEATLTSSVAEKASAVVDLAYRLRIMGSLALSLCHLAAGRVDAVCSLKGARSVDIAAAQLLVRERGLAIELPEAPPLGAAPLDLEGRSRCVAAATPEVCAELFAALSR
ncbi:MAG TPA: inositol monophosphatase family protein [Gaiellaceae bacterium]|nr:inositol monophosphatase family protein [Gaiellaceae bacterium]